MTENESFLQKEMKFARRWLAAKGVMALEEDKNPVNTEIEGYFESVRSGARPKADLEVGLADSTAVILSNLAMDEGRQRLLQRNRQDGPRRKAEESVERRRPPQRPQA